MSSQAVGGFLRARYTGLLSLPQVAYLQNKNPIPNYVIAELYIYIYFFKYCNLKQDHFHFHFAYASDETG